MLFGDDEEDDPITQDEEGEPITQDEENEEDEEGEYSSDEDEEVLLTHKEVRNRDLMYVKSTNIGPEWRESGFRRSNRCDMTP